MSLAITFSRYSDRCCSVSSGPIREGYYRKSACWDLKDRAQLNLLNLWIMLSKHYAKWMYAWETALTTRDTNRIVRPLEWGFDWLQDFSPLAAASHAPAADDFARMIAVNADIVARAEEFFGYQTPTDFRLEARHPQLFPTNVRPETLRRGPPS